MVDPAAPHSHLDDMSIFFEMLQLLFFFFSIWSPTIAPPPPFMHGDLDDGVFFSHFFFSANKTLPGSLRDSAITSLGDRPLFRSPPSKMRPPSESWNFTNLSTPDVVPPEASIPPARSPRRFFWSYRSAPKPHHRERVPPTPPYFPPSVPCSLSFEFLSMHASLSRD